MDNIPPQYQPGDKPDPLPDIIEKALNDGEVFTDMLLSCDQIHMTGQQIVNVKPGYKPDAVYQLFGASTGKINPAETLVKDQVSAYQRFFFRPVYTD